MCRKSCLENVASGTWLAGASSLLSGASPWGFQALHDSTTLHDKRSLSDLPLRACRAALALPPGRSRCERRAERERLGTWPTFRMFSLAARMAPRVLLLDDDADLRETLAELIEFSAHGDAIGVASVAD